MPSDDTDCGPRRAVWNNGKLVGQKAPLKFKNIWTIRVRLQLSHRTRDLALFNLGIDSKLRGCGLVQLRVRDVAAAGRVAARASTVQQKTSMPVRFEITEPTRVSVAAWLTEASPKPGTMFSHHGMHAPSTSAQCSTPGS